MQTTTVLLIILAALIAMIIVLFQYFYNSKNKGKLRLWLSFLRFSALFGVFLLLINPEFTKRDFILEKSNLLLLVDNSSSMKQNEAYTDIDAILNDIRASGDIQNIFDIEKYHFGGSLSTEDSLSFSDKNTDITKALKSLNTIFGNGNGAIVLLTDGNSTIGEDYEYYGRSQKFPIYPIVLGDTTSYEDLKINQVNVNKYAFLNNKFPVESFISYEGEADIRAKFNIAVDGKKVYSQNITLSKDNNTKTINTLLEANSVGLKKIRFDLEPLVNEKNINNNGKNVSVEVINEKTNIAIISDMLHPDLGALKKSLESNEQRSVSIHKPSIDINELQDIDMFILYQPNGSFRNIYDYIKKSKSNTFTVSGPKTDWNFLNDVQNSYTKNSYDQSEEVIPTINKGFSLFDISNFDVDNYPPLETNLGEVLINKSHEILLGQKIKGTEIDEPLLVLAGNGLEREAILFGENIWKWRMQSFREYQSFNYFDEIMGKIILYLSTDRSRSRLVLDYKSLFEGNSDAKITATYFDETFSFDPNASISLSLKNKGTNVSKELPMLLRGNYYEVDLGNMPSGAYDFTVKVANGNVSKSGSFIILDYDVEQQFLSSDYQKLNRLAEHTSGYLYYPSGTQKLIQDLVANNNFKPTRKSNENIVSLVDFKILLGIIILALSTEWFIRKYNGLI
jgi:hypothetical protein